MRTFLGVGRPHQRVAVVSAVLMVLMTAVVGFGVRSLSSLQGEFETFAEEDFPGFNHLLHVDRDLFRAQRALESAFLTSDVSQRQESIVEYELQIQRTNDRWASYLGVAYSSRDEVQLQESYEEHRASWIAVSGRLATAALAVPPRHIADLERQIVEADHHFAEMRAVVHSLEEDFYEPLVERGTDVGRFDPPFVLVGFLLGSLVLGGMISFAAVRMTKRQHVELRARDLNEARTVAQLNARFRSLVESAEDVITIVSEVDTLTLMSPEFGSLALMTTDPTPTAVSELLPADQFAIWSAADECVQQTRTAQSIELTATLGAGTAVYLEAQGAPMRDNHAERVWVWRDITGRKALQMQLAHEAFHDALTGVANRSKLVERCDHALAASSRSGLPVSLLFCDIDEFKAVNDSLGHAFGDELLGIIAERLKTCIRSVDTLARFGGDEFVILLGDSDERSAVTLAERVIDVLGAEVILGGRPIFPSISIGASTALPGTTTDELLRNGDIAMYNAKRAGKARVAVYQEGMHAVAADLLEMQTELKRAAQNDEFELYYQPTITLDTGEVEGLEALIRWNHPTRGFVSPSTFIPLAEATGQIHAVGRWVLEQACHTGVEIQASADRPISMHVNLSPQQLRDPGIGELINDTLVSSGLAPNLLVLEITEGFLLDSDAAVSRLHALHDLGVQIAIDDFGTGYTSINYLQQLPIDILKIDRSFVSGDALTASDRAAFLSAIIDLSRNLNIRAVAEGIENSEQLAELKGLGCSTGQGFFWARPTPRSGVSTLLGQLAGAAAPASRR